MIDDPVDEAILDKIRKLFALSSSPNQHESESALAKAYEIMEKYNVDMSHLATRDDQYVRESYSKRGRAPVEDLFIRWIVEEFFSVKTVHIRGHRGMYTYCIVGKKHNIIIVEYVFGFLRRTFNALWKIASKTLTRKRMSRSRKLKLRNTFYRGIYVGLHSKLKDTKEHFQQQTGIMLVKDANLDDAYAAFFPTATSKKIQLRSPSNRDTGAFLDGFDRGKQIEINKPIGGGSERHLLTN